MSKNKKQISLPEKDYLAILDTIKSFNQCNTRSNLKQCVKEVLFPLFEANAGLYGWIDPDLKTLQFIDNINISDEVIEILKKWIPYDPMPKAMITSSRPVMAVDVDVPMEVARNKWDCFYNDHPHYKAIGYPFGKGNYAVKGVIGAIDLPEPSIVLAVHRVGVGKPMNLRDVRVMELLRPHLLQTIKTIFLNEEVAQFKSLSEKLADCPSPIALVRMDMLVIFVNQAFNNLFQIERGQRLPGDMVELIKKEAAIFAPPYETEHGAIGLPFYISPHGEFRLSLTLLKGRGLVEDKRWLIRLKPVVDSYSKMNLMMQKKGLTGREMETCILVKDGMTNQEIADRLFISLETVKSHLQNIFHKMDVSSRTKLISALNKNE